MEPEDLSFYKHTPHEWIYNTLSDKSLVNFAHCPVQNLYPVVKICLLVSGSLFITRPGVNVHIMVIFMDEKENILEKFPENAMNESGMGTG